jgi:alpha-1,2-glucosyltransferase
VIFFSWPVVLPHVKPLLDKPNQHAPRLALFFGFTVLAVLVIAVNTVVHPFTLADNRHYPFYVFRYFILPPFRKFLLGPIYVICGWLCILALTPAASTNTARISTGTKTAADEPHTVTFARVDTVHVSFVLVFFISTALSLVTAPLVEPRYFIIPWLIWRLHVPELLGSDTAQAETQKAASKGNDKQAVDTIQYHLLTLLGRHALSVELLWYLTVNWVTGYLFIARPFAWTQEPGKLQRFMW